MKRETEIMTVEELRRISAQIAEIHQEMKYLTKLAPEQRAEHKRRIGPRELHLLQNRVKQAGLNRKLIPSTVDLAQLEEDLSLTTALAGLLTNLDQIRADVHDTFLTVGHRTAVSAASTNVYIKVASTTAERLNPTERSRKSRVSGSSVVPAIVAASAAASQTGLPLPVVNDPTRQAA